MIESMYQETEESMQKAIDALKNEFKKVRTGRASLSILDDIRVDYYGTLTPLNQMASLSTPRKPIDYYTTLGRIRYQRCRKGDIEIRPWFNAFQ